MFIQRRPEDERPDLHAFRASSVCRVSAETVL
jgi:hypothetical protein